ncbi:reticulon-like protein B17 isoform X2 [Ipomoea triloba]|uniref:reticulon-like protein B17 isoform X2 n=1 Tax=Ipomoea triloba TaxID=35885 RepID=UPI00125D7A25|nr:reticulon-like protein B17 isoform X2 [Ipomoea triloba]
METTPQSHRSEPRSRLKSASRLSKLRCSDDHEIPHLDMAPSPPPSASSPKHHYSLPVRDLLLLSPSLLRKSRTRLAEKLEIGEDGVELSGGRRRSRNGNAGGGAVLGCASPRNHRRRSRRRLELEMMREDKDLGVGEEMIKRKKRHSGRSKKDKLGLVPISSPKSSECEGEGVNLDRIGEMVNDLVMWRDVARSSLWFGFGSICFLSSCFASGVSISIVSLVSQLGLLFLVVSFLSNSIRPRGNVEVKCDIQLKEDDILRMGRMILPTANLAILKTRELFSGEPAMTLKVVPFLLVGAEYGHLLSLWRLCAFGFFMSFTAPKLYSSYSSQICRKGEYLKCRVMESWGACSHKKTIAASALTAFWNLTTARTRIFAAFICFVVIRYCRQRSEANMEEEIKLPEDKDEPEDGKALIVFE